MRNAALKKAYQLVVMEDENTSYQTIGPVSKAMNMMSVTEFASDQRLRNLPNLTTSFCSCRWLEEGPDSEAFKLHVDKIRDFMWYSKEGLMMTGRFRSAVPPRTTQRMR